MYIGHTRAYFADYVKFRLVGYEVYRTNNAKPVSIEKYLHLPYMDATENIDLQQEIEWRKQFTDGKRT